MTTASWQGARMLGTGVAALALVSALVVRTSDAVFTAETSNTGNVIGAGTLVLEHAPASTMFNITDMEPGQTITECVDVTYSGTIPDPSEVRIFSGGYTDSTAGVVSPTLAERLTVTIEEGASCGAMGTTTSLYSGTLAAFDGTHTDYVTGVSAWDPFLDKGAGETEESRGHQVSFTLDADADNQYQAQSVTDLVFTWYVQN